MINRPSWANQAKYEQETANAGYNKFECRPYKVKIVGIIPKPEYEGFVICFDINEQGSMYGMFTKEFKEKQCGTLEQWNNKGRYYVSYKESSQQMFEAFITSIQNSNQGYQWNWDEQSLKGKELVMVYGEEEYLDKQTNQVKLAISPRQPRSIRALNNNDIKYPLPVKKLKNDNYSYKSGNNYNYKNVAPTRNPNVPNNYNSNSNPQPTYQAPQNVQVNDDDLPF